MTEVAIRPGASRHGATTGRKDDPKRERRTRGTQSNRAPVHASDVPERIRPSQSEPRREYKSRYVILERAATAAAVSRTHARIPMHVRTSSPVYSPIAMPRPFPRLLSSRSSRCFPYFDSLASRCLPRVPLPSVARRPDRGRAPFRSIRQPLGESFGALAETRNDRSFRRGETRLV